MAWLRGTVKQVLSGDTLIISGGPAQGGPPPERQLTLSAIIAPRMGRRDGTSRDEPFAWEAREYLRTRAIGASVTFRVEYTAAGRDFGSACVGPHHLGVALVAAGLARVKDAKPAAGVAGDDEATASSLAAAQSAAQAASLGLWGPAPAPPPPAAPGCPPPGSPPEAIAASILATHRGSPLSAVVESFTSGSSLRVTLLPSRVNLALMVAGITCPSLGRRPVVTTTAMAPGGGDDATATANTAGAVTVSATSVAAAVGATPPPSAPEPFSREAKHAAEVVALGREVTLVLHGCDKYGHLAASVACPDPSTPGSGSLSRDLGEHLCRAGLAKTTEWALALMAPPAAATRLRAAERAAKDARCRLWAGYVPPPTAASPLKDAFDGRVVEVTSGDAVIVRDGASGVDRRVALASVRSPKVGNPRREVKPEPYAAEAKEYLRRLVIGATVRVDLEYTRRVPASAGPGEGQPGAAAAAATERVMSFGTVWVDGASGEAAGDKADGPAVAAGPRNVGESIVARGLATVVRHRGDEERSAHIESLLSAESKAAKAKRGVHSTKEPPPVPRVNDASADAAKARAFLPALQRGGAPVSAVVDYVLSGHRLKLAVPREGCTLVLNLAGVRAPQRDEPYAAEAVAFLRDLVLQRDIEAEVDTADRSGTFIGTIRLAGAGPGGRPLNLGVAIVEAGLAAVTPQCDRTPTGPLLLAAQAAAQAARRKMWTQYIEPVDGGDANGGGGEPRDGGEPRVGAWGGHRASATPTSEPVTVTEVMPGGMLWVRRAPPAAVPPMEDRLAALAEAEAAGEVAPGPPGWQPKVGTICRARFTADNAWYRAHVDRLTGDGPAGVAAVTYIDYGNAESVSLDRLAPLETALASEAALAVPCVLAHIKWPSPEGDYAAEADAQLAHLAGGRQLNATVVTRETLVGKQPGGKAGAVRWHVTLREVGSDATTAAGNGGESGHAGGDDGGGDDDNDDDNGGSSGVPSPGRVVAPTVRLSINAQLVGAGLARLPRHHAAPPAGGDVGPHAGEVIALRAQQAAARAGRLALWRWGDADSDDDMTPARGGGGGPVRNRAK